MTIREISDNRKLFGAPKKVEDRANSIIDGFLEKLSFSSMSPQEIINLYFKDDSILADLESEWATHIQHNIKVGRKSEHIFMQSIGQYRLAHYIESEFNFIIHPRNFEFLSFTQSKFRELAKMEVAMLLTKYEDIHSFEVKIAILKMLFTYFRVYSINGITGLPQWNFTAADIIEVFNEILDSDLSTFKKHFDIINPCLQVLIPHGAIKPKPEKIKPTCAKDLLVVIDDSMTQQEKRHAIMVAWNLPSERAARTYMQKYGMTRNYSKKANEKTIENNDMNIIQSYEMQINQLKKQVSELQSQNERLREENNELRQSQGLPQQTDILERNLIPELKKKEDVKDNSKDYANMTTDELFSEWAERQEKIEQMYQTNKERMKADSEANGHQKQ